jgi:hypothetical protein
MALQAIGQIHSLRSGFAGDAAAGIPMAEPKARARVRFSSSGLGRATPG